MEPEAASDRQQHTDAPQNRITSPLATFHHRPGYQRISSAQEEDTAFQDSRPTGVSELPEDDSVHGLKIRFSDHDEEALAFNGSPNPQPGSGDYLLSPLSARSSKHGRHASLGGTSPYADDTSSFGRSSQSSMSRLEKPFTADPEDEQLFVQKSRSSVQSFDTSGARYVFSLFPFQPNFEAVKQTLTDSSISSQPWRATMQDSASFPSSSKRLPFGYHPCSFCLLNRLLRHMAWGSFSKTPLWEIRYGTWPSSAVHGITADSWLRQAYRVVIRDSLCICAWPDT